MPEVQLVIVDGPNAGREFQVTGSLVLGRDASAGIVLEDAEASRRHATVTATVLGAEVEDLGSTNGTFVNGERLTGKREISAGDKVRIGTTVIEVRPQSQATKIASTIPEDTGRTMVASTIPQAPAEPSVIAGGEPAPEDDLPTVAPEPTTAAAPPPEPAPAPAPAPPPASEPVPSIPQAAAPPPPPPAESAPPPPPPAFDTTPPAQAPTFGPPPGPPGFPPPPTPAQLPAQQAYVPGAGFQVRNPVAEWLLCLFVPFYGLFWYYRLCKEIGEWSGGRIHTSPGTSLLAVTLGGMVVVPAIISINGTMNRLRQCQQMAGVEPRASFWGYLGRMFLFGYAYKWITDQTNELAERQPVQ